MSSSDAERLFPELCHSLGLTVQKVPEQVTKTPDFKVTAPSGAFYAEVKDLKPNPDEKRLLEKFRETKSISFSLKLGHRAWGMIDEARYQLRAVSDQGLPAVIVLYDNIRLDDGTRFCEPGPLSAEHITAAMFGKWVVDLKIDKSTGEVLTSNDRCGQNESFTKDIKTYVSAVMVLSDYFESLTATLYHNPFTSVPLPIGVFKGSNCYNMKISIADTKRPQSWVRCDSFES